MSTHTATKPQSQAASHFSANASGLLQRKCACGNHTVAGGECAECRNKREGMLQRTATSAAPVNGVPPIVHDALRLPGQLPDAATRVFREPRFGHDLSRIPTRSPAVGAIQTKLAINKLGDEYEQEADRIADQVLAAPAHSVVSGAYPHIQRFGGQPTGQAEEAPASVDRVLASSGRPLDPALQQDMEQRFGHDFSRVRVHSGAAAEQSAREVNAHAYTMGHNIVFGTGQFAPGTQAGRRLIAHELTHVVQQHSIDRNGPTSQWPMIQRQSESSGAPAGEPGNRPDLEFGDAAGPGVSLLKGLLGVRPTTGRFDQATHKKVVAFQQKRPELHPATGGVGPKTWKALDAMKESLANDPFPETSTEEQISKFSLSDRGSDFIIKHEGVRTHSYNDSAGHCTIGVGHLVHRGNCNKAELKAGIDRERALELFQNDVSRFEDIISNNVKVRINQAQYDALVSFTFNTGRLPGTNVLQELNLGLYSRVPGAMMQWVKPPELRGRRTDEAKLFKAGIY